MSKFPIIVLDGPDGTGKSTLAQAMVKELGARYLHLTYRWKNKMFDYHTAAISTALIWSETQPVVIDRWWPSEIVYADAYRGGSRWPLGHRLFEKIALKHAVTYVFCIPQDKDAYLKHYNELKGKRVEMYDEGMERVYDGFVKIFSKLSRRMGVSLYDYTKDGHHVSELAHIFNSLAHDYRVDQWQPALDRKFLNFTGHIGQAKYLVIGDQLKPKTRREVWPFFEYGNSSQWWAEALDFAGVPEHDIISMNALMPDDSGFERRVKTFIDEYPGQGLKVLALGGNASKYLDTLKTVEYTQIHHPQYYRRFRSSDGKHIVKETFSILRKEYA